MGNRITRAATHLSRDAVQKRMQEEQHPWRRQRWEIIYQALTTPRKAEDIARTVGVSPSTVHRVIAAYNHAGVAAIDTPGKGGRRHQYLTLEQEQILLQPFLTRAARGEMVTAVEIKLALEARIGHEVNKSTLYRLLDRQGWQQIGAQASPAQAKGASPLKQTGVRCGRRAGPLKERLLPGGSGGSSRPLSTLRGSCHPSATPVT